MFSALIVVGASLTTIGTCSTAKADTRLMSFDSLDPGSNPNQSQFVPSALSAGDFFNTTQRSAG